MLEKKIILNVGITDASKEEILEYIIKGLAENGKKYFVVTPNPEILVMADKNIDYQKVLNRAEIALADGIGVVIAGQILGKPLKGRITGVDLLESLCLRVAEKPITVGFLGGGHGVAEKTAECLLLRHPKLKISFIGEEWTSKGFIHNNEKIEGRKLKIENKKSIYPLASTVKIPSSTLYHLPSSVDILFVAFGAPKQELWIDKNLDKLPVKVAIGVGGAFDYISGEVKRAPLIIRLIGFEWLFRLIFQPWRLRRQLALLKFTCLVLKEKFSL